MKLIEEAIKVTLWLVSDIIMAKPTGNKYAPQKLHICSQYSSHLTLEAMIRSLHLYEQNDKDIGLFRVMAS